MTESEIRAREPHDEWCAWLYDQVQQLVYGRFPVLERECNCTHREEWLRGGRVLA